MDRAYRISNLWNWLPAFRTVAETEHLPTAARALHLSPSALSRSVKHLETEVGHALFDREGRRMRLNRAGEQLLEAVRDAMRRVDDGLDGTTGLPTRLRIAGPAAWLQCIVLPALHAAAPDRAVAAELADPVEDGAHALLCGELDLVIAEHGLTGDQLVVHHLGVITHALCRAPRPIELDHELPHAVWTGGPDVADGHDPADVALRTPQLALVIDACRAGRVQAVLPTAVARAAGLELRHPVPLPSGQLYLARRRPLAESRIEELVERLRAQASTILSRPGQ